MKLLFLTILLTSINAMAVEAVECRESRESREKILLCQVTDRCIYVGTNCEYDPKTITSDSNGKTYHQVRHAWTQKDTSKCILSSGQVVIIEELRIPTWEKYKSDTELFSKEEAIASCHRKNERLKITIGECKS